MQYNKQVSTALGHYKYEQFMYPSATETYPDSQKLTYSHGLPCVSTAFVVKPSCMLTVLRFRIHCCCHVQDEWSQRMWSSSGSKGRVCVCSMVSSNGQAPLSSAKHVKPNFISLCIFTIEIERVSDNSDGVPDKWTVNVLSILFFLILNKYSNSFNIGLRCCWKNRFGTLTDKNLSSCSHIPNWTIN